MFDIALREKDLESGLTKPDILDLYEMIKEEECYPIEFQGEFSAAMGFISTKAAETLNYDYETSGLADFIKGIVNNMERENADSSYNFQNLKVWINR